MSKIIMAAIMLAVISAVSVKAVLSQEGQQQSDPAIAALSNRMDSMEQSQKQILQRLDKILANQERIFAELDIIKIRATKR